MDIDEYLRKVQVIILASIIPTWNVQQVISGLERDYKPISTVCHCTITQVKWTLVQNEERQL